MPLLACWVALFSVWASAQVRIEEIGLRGYYSLQPVPTRVRIELSNPASSPQTLALRFRIIYLAPGMNRADTYNESVELGPREGRKLDSPLLIAQVWRAILEVEARDPAGRLVGRDARLLETSLSDSLVAIVCRDQKACQAAQTEIQFSGTSEQQTQKAKALKFVFVHEPPQVWWAYAPAYAVVVAAPLESLAPEQQAALEGYLRQGGRLILLEERTGRSSFLAAYPMREPGGTAQIVGKGKLYRIRSLETHQLGSLLSVGPFQTLTTAFMRVGPVQDELGWVVRRLATSFTFPRLGWLLVWLGVYILVVGFVNLTLLEVFKRREWGWVTVPVLAVLFASGLYLSSAAKRPKNFGVDQITLYWMDDQSPLGAADVGIRVSAPHYAKLDLSVSGDTVFVGDPQSSAGSSYIDLGTTTYMFGGQGWKSGGVQFDFGPPHKLQLGLLQWSFEDLSFRALRPFPGTVHRLGPTQLRNETGQNFLQALYIDKDRVYFLDRVAAGAEVDIAAARQKPLASESGRNVGFPGYPNQFCGPGESSSEGEADPQRAQKALEEWRELPHQPFSLVELIRGWPKGAGCVFDVRSGLFIGLSDGPVYEAGLQGLTFARKSYAVTVISFAKPLTPEKR